MIDLGFILSFKKEFTLNKKSTFYLARHGQTEWNIERRIQGQLDSPLTDLGKQQAVLLGEQCRQLKITQVLSSPLGRALQTAELCAETLQLNVKKVTGFEERHFGCWQGKLISEVNTDSKYAEMTSQITECKPDQGESAIQSLTRFQIALKDLLEKNVGDETYLIIAHGEILRCFMADLKQQKQTATGYDYQNGEIIAIVYDHVLQQFLI